MTNQERIKWLTTGPVMKTRQGVRQRIKSLSLKDLMILTSYYSCNIEELEKILRRENQ